MDAPLSHLLARCLAELRQWLGAHPRERRPNDVYARIERQLRQLRRVRDPDEAARRVREIELLIRDEGPVSEAFLPALEEIHETVSQGGLSQQTFSEEG